MARRLFCVIQITYKPSPRAVVVGDYLSRAPAIERRDELQAREGKPFETDFLVHEFALSEQ